MASNREKYVELSIAGKWQALAREIVTDNPGITRAKFIEMAAPLMPRHINGYGRYKKTGPISLASRAISALMRSNAIYAVDEKLYPSPRFVPEGHTLQILEFASVNKTVEKKDFRDVKNFCKFACQLCKRGLLERVSKGVYKKVEATNDAT